MKFIVTENYEAMSRTAARVISGYVSSHPDCVLGLATGSTPIGLTAAWLRIARPAR